MYYTSKDTKKLKQKSRLINKSALNNWFKTYYFTTNFLVVVVLPNFKLAK